MLSAARETFMHAYTKTEPLSLEGSLLFSHVFVDARSGRIIGSSRTFMTKLESFTAGPAAFRRIALRTRGRVHSPQTTVVLSRVMPVTKMSPTSAMHIVRRRGKGGRQKRGDKRHGGFRRHLRWGFCVDEVLGSVWSERQNALGGIFD